MAQAFTYVGGEQHFNISNDGYYLIEVWGASGENRSDVAKADGGYTRGIFYLQTSDIRLTVFPGQAGGLSQTGQGGDGHGHVNGGNGTIGEGAGGGGGGAGSYVTIGNFTTLEDCLVISGAGGGTAGSGTATFGGRGGGVTGEAGRPRPGPAGPTSNAGKPASGTTVGAGGNGTVANGQPGNIGLGGNAGIDVLTGFSGGGGGGGYRGGGGGGVEAILDNMCGGGGGGNGYLNELLVFPGTEVNVRSDQTGYIQNPNLGGLQTANGYVRITPQSEVCIAEGSVVTLLNGVKTCIENLRPGYLIKDSRGNDVQVEKVVAFKIPSRQFVLVEKGCLGQQKPTSDLLIRPGHPILIGGKEVLPESLIGNVYGVSFATLERPLHYFTVVTQKRLFVDIQGIPVATWGNQSWANQEAELQMTAPFSYL